METIHANLDATFAALSNSTRRKIIARLMMSDATVNELAEPFEMSLPGISKHIKVLEQAGILQQKKIGKFRRCSLRPKPLEDISNWAEQYRPIWDARFDKIDTIICTEE